VIAFKNICCYSDHNGAPILAVTRIETTNTSYNTVIVKIASVLHVISCTEHCSKNTTSLSADVITIHTDRQISQHNAYDQFV